jgi:hypothetical protein
MLLEGPSTPEFFWREQAQWNASGRTKNPGLFLEEPRTPGCFGRNLAPPYASGGAKHPGIFLEGASTVECFWKNQEPRYVTGRTNHPGMFLEGPSTRNVSGGIKHPERFSRDQAPGMFLEGSSTRDVSGGTKHPESFWRDQAPGMFLEGPSTRNVSGGIKHPERFWRDQAPQEVSGGTKQNRQAPVRIAAAAAEIRTHIILGLRRYVNRPREHHRGRAHLPLASLKGIRSSQISKLLFRGRLCWAIAQTHDEQTHFCLSVQTGASSQNGSRYIVSVRYGLLGSLSGMT